MLQWFRARSRSIAATALLSLVTLTISSAGPHQDDCHEAICAATLPHDATAHTVSRDTPSPHRPFHCVLCHWTRIVRPPATAADSITPGVDSTVRFLIDVAYAPEGFLAAQPPLRAPPSSSLFA